MKPRFLWTTAAVVTSLAAAVSAALIGGSSLDKFDSALAAAQGLDVTFSVRELGGAPHDYRVTLAKPDKAKIVTPEKTIVADGNEITTYLPKDHVYFKKKQTQAELLAAFDEPGLSVWTGFFDTKASLRHANAKDNGTLNLGGQNYLVVKAEDTRGGTTTTYYLGAKDYLAHKVEFQAIDKGKTLSTLLNANSISLSAGDVFAFNPPANAQEVTEASLLAGHWLNDWSQAMAAAKATGKLVMVDFMASWCGPCKALDKESFSTEAFKDKAKDFVLLKIDIDQQPALAQKYGVEAIPNVQFIDANGKVVHKWLGLIPLQDVLKNMETAKSKAH